VPDPAPDAAVKNIEQTQNPLAVCVIVEADETLALCVPTVPATMLKNVE